MRSSRIAVTAACIAGALSGCADLPREASDQAARALEAGRAATVAPLVPAREPRVVEAASPLLPLKPLAPEAAGAWLRRTRVGIDLYQPVPVSAVLQMLAAQGVSISTPFPLDGYSFAGRLPSTDAETALRCVLGSVGLDFSVDDEHRIVTVRTLGSRTWYMNLGNRRAAFSTMASGGGSATPGGSGSGQAGTPGGSSGGAPGSSSGSSSGASTSGAGGSSSPGGGPASSSSSMPGSSSGSGNGVAVGDDFWSSLTSELTARLTVLVPVARAPAPLAGGSGAGNAAATGGPVGRLPIVPVMLPQPGQAPAGSGTQDLFVRKQVGSFSLNPDTGSITVQAPAWLLDELGAYGSMDGAMKFVKGDAIAGLIIVAVNLLGGIVIGTLQRGMTSGAAVKTYSILTIGDGLIAQIPALFISICAGMIVTRVSTSDGGPSNVGRDIGKQVLSQPKALLIGSAVMLGLGMIPGMPTATFIALGLTLSLVGYSLLRGERRVVDSKTGQVTTVNAIDQSTAAETKAASAQDNGKDGFNPTVPLTLEVHSGLEKAFSADLLNEELVKIRRALYYDLGLVFPGIQLRFADRLPPENYTIQIAEIPVSQGRLRRDHVMVREEPDNLTALSIPFETDRDFLPGIPSVWVAAGLKEALAKASISFLEPTQMLSYHLALVLKKYAAEFVGIQETRTLLQDLEARSPDLAKELQRVMPTHKIAEIFQRLVSEEVSIRNIRAVCEALIEWGQKEKDSVLLTEYVRMALKRHISHKHSSGQNILPAYLLAPAVEDAVRGAVRQTSAGSYLALDPQLSKKLVENIKKTVGDIGSGIQRPVLLTSMDIRRYVRKMIEQELYELAVVSYQELTPDINIQPLARVEL